MMKLTSTLLIFFLPIFALAQIVSGSNTFSNENLSKAYYLKGELRKDLSLNLFYQDIDFRNTRDGDIVVSFLISKEGVMDSVEILSSPSEYLEKGVKLMLEQIDRTAWSPTKFENKAIDRKYKIVFSYRVYINELPGEMDEEIIDEIRNKKWKKALRKLKKASREHPYEMKYFLFTSQVYEKIGKLEKSIKAYKKYISLQNEIMDIIPIHIYAKSMTKTYRFGNKHPGSFGDAIEQEMIREGSRLRR